MRRSAFSGVNPRLALDRPRVLRPTPDVRASSLEEEIRRTAVEWRDAELRAIADHEARAASEDDADRAEKVSPPGAAANTRGDSESRCAPNVDIGWSGRLGHCRQRTPETVMAAPASFGRRA